MATTASSLGVADLLRKQAVARAGAVAIEDACGALSYDELRRWTGRVAAALASAGVGLGDRIAVLAENRREYIALQIAAAEIGAMVACLNWRLADTELTHCLRLAAPRVVFVSARYAALLARSGWQDGRVVTLDDDFDAWIGEAGPHDPPPDVDPEHGLVILYTSGTTGLPKGAVISQRAMVARAMCFSAEYGITAEHAYIAWSPLFHMAATDFSLATLMIGGKVIVQDGLDVDRLCATLERETVGWLVAMPGMIDQLIDGLRRNGTRPRGVRQVGAMADLVPRQQIAELTALLGAPYINSFGATETGLAPASGSLLAPGVVPASLAKRESGFCRVRLVDAEDRDVPVGTPGEAAVRGPTLFSGYWNAPEVNARDFRGGWFHMGDLFVRHPDGTLDFVDRAKYLIKSGGENIYPAEIERVLLALPAVADAAVVRRRDERWGEVPVAFVALEPGCTMTADALRESCRAALAGYKIPKEFRIVELASFPRSSTGKIQRHEIERQWLQPEGAPTTDNTRR
ncbi:MAG TPA: AMP-binding protein [Rubrivivax sp.]|nr:AMP-binding protein [Rubrivivax sp.]